MSCLNYKCARARFDLRHFGEHRTAIMTAREAAPMRHDGTGTLGAAVEQNLAVARTCWKERQPPRKPEIWLCVAGQTLRTKLLPVDARGRHGAQR